MITDKDHKKLLVAGLRLRDQLGGHHFLQFELGGGSPSTGPQWSCRDCGVKAILEPDAWATWVKLLLAAPDGVREALMQPACGNVVKR